MGMTSDEQFELLQSAVALRVEGRNVPESVRRALAVVEESLIDVIGPIVRKRVAARLLGCSVQALDRWIAKGAIATESSAGQFTRTYVTTAELVDLATEIGIHANIELHRYPLASGISALRERRWRTTEFQNACNLISFTSSIEVAAWERRYAS